MRDPKRIRDFCDRLADIWESQCPDWRFGQLINNVFGGNDHFYTEEEDMMQMFERHFKCEAERGEHHGS